MTAAYVLPAEQASALNAAAGLRTRLPESDHLMISGTEHGEIDITVVRLAGDTDEHMRAVIDRIDRALMGDHIAPHVERRNGHPRVYAVHGQYLAVPVHAEASLFERKS